MLENGQELVRDRDQFDRVIADDVARLVVALSGGADSVAMLHWLVNA